MLKIFRAFFVRTLYLCLFFLLPYMLSKYIMHNIRIFAAAWEALIKTSRNGDLGKKAGIHTNVFAFRSINVTFNGAFRVKLFMDYL